MASIAIASTDMRQGDYVHYAPDTSGKLHAWLMPVGVLLSGIRQGVLLDTVKKGEACRIVPHVVIIERETDED